MNRRMTIKPDVNVKRSRLWYLLPIFLGVIGGVAAYFYLRAGDPTLAKSTLWLGIILSATVASLALAIYIAYVRDIAAAKEKISSGSNVINTAQFGPVEYADVGEGAPILAIHGTGGGFDQGLLTAKSFMGDDITDTHRVIAPSRFGYLKTPMPTDDNDRSPAAQADAHAVMLDALGTKGKVTVIGASAGALSAAEFAAKYPDRVSVLVLAVPAAWSPDAAASEDSAEIGSNDFIMKTVLRSDFVMWVITKLAGDQMISFLGVPSELQQSMTPKERENTERLIQMIQPVSQRYEGIKQDAENHQNRQRIALEQITAPTIIVDAKDVVTYPGSKYTAEHIPNAKLVEFETGGHLLIGHGDEAIAVIRQFMQMHESPALVARDTDS
jgi:2-hydroxy-6-oxonona-2,4-dienedioate hydrolase